MALDVTVCVPTFGDSSWFARAEAVAIPSAQRATEMYHWRWMHLHGDTLHETRNALLADVRTEFVCFLDADDELEPHYFEHMEKSDAEIRVPSVRYVKNGFDQGVRMPKVAGHSHDCTADCLSYGNWIVIGAVAPTGLLRHVGGFRDFPWSEDWDLWVRCWQEGATIEAVSRAVYRAHVRRNSRNRGLAVEERIAAHNLIAEANGLPLVPA